MVAGGSNLLSGTQQLKVNFQKGSSTSCLIDLRGHRKNQIDMPKS